MTPESILDGHTVHILCAVSIEDCIPLVPARWVCVDVRKCPDRPGCSHYQFVPPRIGGEKEKGKHG